VKALFGSLLCLVLATSECFALSGGPVYGGGKANVVGTYAGVLQGAFDPTNPISSNSIGIFSLGIPKTGTGGGNFVMFAQGRTFTGTVRGVGDAAKASLKAILTATFNYNLTVGVTDPVTGVFTLQTVPVTASVNGSMNAQVKTTRSSSIFTSTGATRLKGDAVLNIDQGEVANNGQPILTGVLALGVTGFKQSDTATAVTAGG
jgi:hypothetical protein